MSGVAGHSLHCTVKSKKGPLVAVLSRGLGNNNNYYSYYFIYSSSINDNNNLSDDDDNIIYNHYYRITVVIMIIMKFRLPVYPYIERVVCPYLKFCYTVFTPNTCGITVQSTYGTSE